MMRYQRVSPDCLPLSNGKKPNLRPSTTTPSSKDDNGGNNGGGDDGRSITNGGLNNNHFDGVVAKGFRFRSPSRSKDLNNNNNNNNHNLTNSGTSNSPIPLSENIINHHDNGKNPNLNPNPNPRLYTSPGSSPSPNRGDVLLQWGQKKRSRVSRAEIRSVTVTDSSSSSSGQGKQQHQQQHQQSNKLQRRNLNATMPPPPPPPPLPSTATSHRKNNGSNNNRSSQHRNGLLTTKETSGFISNRNLEEKSMVPNGSPSRNSGSSSRSAVSRSAAGKQRSPQPEKVVDRKICCSGSTKDEKQNGSGLKKTDRVLDHSGSVPVQSEQEANNTGLVVGGGEKTVEVWPRIYIGLSRKEKEEDFLAMKGTKLPHRPKKRAKNVDKALQYCFPGMWLSDLTKSRYEVREKKCTKKQKRKGLKGMESMESDSE